MTIPFSASADRNKEVIGDALAGWLERVSTVVEIGSGTGQHAVYLGARFPGLRWQPTDRRDNLAAIERRRADAAVPNVLAAVELDVGADGGTPDQQFDMAYSANTAHIMSLSEVEKMFSIVGQWLCAGGVFALYGPFHYAGEHTADSNLQFDRMLRQQAAHMGVRDKLLLDEFAATAGLRSIEDLEMPSNNRIVVWQRESAGTDRCHTRQRRG